MSFLNITDAKKRDEIVADYIATVRKIKERNENEKLVGLSRTAELEQTYQPIIQSQQMSAEKISQAITQQEKKPFLEYEEGSELERLILRYKTKDDTIDSTFGIKFTEHGSFIGKTSVSFDGDDIIIEERRYEGTRQLWALITEKTEQRITAMQKNITNDDYKNYCDILIQTHVLHQDSNPKRAARSSGGWKWKNILSKIWEIEMKEGESEGDGIFLPGDIKGLKTKLNLLLAEFRAGNTTTRNEIVFILDELLRRKQMSKKEYK